jgi:outer membrane lipoprotein
MKMLRGILPGVVLLSGCAGPAISPVANEPPGNPPLAAVRAAPEQYTGEYVRWGGTIARVENRESETWIEIVSRELKQDGRPMDKDYSEGRFLARFDGFHDPVIYKADRKLTVIGTIEGTATRDIGEYSYTYPIVHVQSHRLWMVSAEALPYDSLWSPYRPYPYYFYDPWYPFYRPYWCNRFWPYRCY